MLILWDLRLLITTVGLSLLTQGKKLDFQEIFGEQLSYSLNNYLRPGTSRAGRVLGGPGADTELGGI